MREYLSGKSRISDSRIIEAIFYLRVGKKDVVKLEGLFQTAWAVVFPQDFQLCAEDRLNCIEYWSIFSACHLIDCFNAHNLSFKSLEIQEHLFVVQAWALREVQFTELQIYRVQYAQFQSIL